MEAGRWPRLVRAPRRASARDLPCLPPIQGRPLSYKTFLIWVLISIYQGKEGRDHLLPLLWAPPRGQPRCSGVCRTRGSQAPKPAERSVTACAWGKPPQRVLQTRTGVPGGLPCVQRCCQLNETKSGKNITSPDPNLLRCVSRGNKKRSLFLRSGCRF